MNIKEYIRDDLWKAVETHYQNSDYTAALRDAIFFISELIRERSGLHDKDGAKLVESSFLGKNPSIKINKGETETERNMQEGIGYALKGIMMAIRNPLSHEPIEYQKNDTDTILLFVNYLLSFVDKSKKKTKIEDFLTFIKDSNFPHDEEYAEVLVNEVPKKKRLDLLVEIFNTRDEFSDYSINNFIKKLDERLSVGEREIFVNLIDQELLLCQDDIRLRKFIHFFTPLYYKHLSSLTAKRLERILLKSLIAGKVDENGKCCKEGALATWINAKIKMLELREKFIEKLYNKIETSEEDREYVLKFFGNAIFNDDEELTEHRKEIIKNYLDAFDRTFVYEMHRQLSAVFDIEPNSTWAIEFKEKLEQSFQQVREFEDIPF